MQLFACACLLPGAVAGVARRISVGRHQSEAAAGRAVMGPRRRHILAVMVRCLGGFVLALVVASAPSALTACELVCAAHDDGGGVPAHTCHSSESDDTTSTTRITSGVHVCGHGDELPAASGKLMPEGAPGPAIAAAASPFLLAGNGVSGRSRAVTSSPPSPPKLATHLRI